MSAKLTLEVHDDGRITMTGKATKAGEVVTTEIGPVGLNRVAGINLLAGSDDTTTHRLLIGDISTIERIQRLTQTSAASGGSFAVYTEWWS